MNRAEHRICTMCRVLEVSTSGYYAWRRRKASPRQQKDEDLLSKIKVIHKRSRGTYGAPRLHIQLAREGTFVGRKRVARLMRQAGIQGVSRRRWTLTTVRNQRAQPAPDLVERDFSATGPDLLWVADITYVATGSGFLYLAVVVDVFGRRVVGWSMKSHLRTSLVEEALEMAVCQRRPPGGLIHHSDQGCQYTSLAFGARCRKAGIRPSMGSVGDCYDNALCESFFATLECELLDRHHFRTHSQASLAIFDYIEGWYNPHRLHSSLGYQSPAQFERNYYQQQSVPH